MKSNEHIIKEVNQLGKGKYICHNPRAENTKRILVIVKCLDTGKLSKPTYIDNIRRGSNPFLIKNRYDKNQITKEVNKFGKGKYICHNPYIGKNKFCQRLVIIKCLKTNKLSKPTLFGDLKNGHNPFMNVKKSNDQITKEVNKFGKGKYICHNPRSGKTRLGINLVIVMCLKTNKLSKPIQISKLKDGFNPFDLKKNFLEINKIQPQYEKLLKKLNISYIKEFRLGKKRIDFLLFLKTKRIGLEVKQSDKWHSYKNQLSNYKKIGSLKQYKISKILLSDPLGKHKNKGSISIKQLSQFLLQNKN